MKSKILNTPYHLSLLAELRKPETVQPRFSQIIDDLYSSLFAYVVDNELEREGVKFKTRIFSKDKRGVYSGKIVKPKQKIVMADVLRAGAQPAQLFYMKLTSLLDPKYVRQDHIMSQRVEGKTGVEGTDLMASKIGGTVRNSIVIIPDPMGATGGSMAEVIEFYEKTYGPAKRYVPVHLVIVPQYLKKLKKIKAPISVYAIEQDKGLTDDDFIYPGIGGVGELINNTKY